MLVPRFHKRVRLVDLDGTIFFKPENFDYVNSATVLLPGAKKKLEEWFEQGDTIIFWTARPPEYREQIIKILDDYGIVYHDVICGKPYAEEIHIYDDRTIISHHVKRNEGIGKLDE